VLLIFYIYLLVDNMVCFILKYMLVLRFLNAPCLHLKRFCAAGLSSGLATRVILTRVSRGRLGESITRGGPASDFIFVPWYVIVVGLRFKCYTLYTQRGIRESYTPRNFEVYALRLV
jgi:hypothetical protein